MAFKQVIETTEYLDTPIIKKEDAARFLNKWGIKSQEMKLKNINGDKEQTLFVKIKIPGKNGKTKGGASPTLGIIGRLGGIGARPEQIGLVSDADGAIIALSAAAKIAVMRDKGDHLQGDVIISTHLCPKAPVIPHHPVPFMGSPVSIEVMNQHEVDPCMEAILSIDTTKANRITNHKGFAISPTVKSGYILRVSESLLDIMEWVTGKLPVVFPLTIQDITPYGNELFHINSILQPSTATPSPVVGVAITSEVPVPGCATGANHLTDLESAVRFVLEVAKSYGKGTCPFTDEKEFQKLLSLYGPLDHLQTLGKQSI
ncbi:MAG: DUF1177 family protein [Candidatus Aminicenantes bacterium]|nr:DUF1177 family protein [Candidatus Aminicenantes bacterium]